MKQSLYHTADSFKIYLKKSYLLTLTRNVATFPFARMLII
jgi:hypothetical protein